jgi:DNA-directed RNA polymerase specialized sigma24 family protein
VPLRKMNYRWALHLGIEMAGDGDATRKARWALTADTFDRLLDALDPDRERAAVKYEHLRHRLIGLLGWWGSPAAEELADVTLDRVARKLKDHTPIAAASLGAYVRGVARLVFYESTRDRRAALTGEEPAVQTASDGAEAGECLDRCLSRWEAADRDLLLRYYAAGKASDLRKQIADELAITTTALRIRTHRLRARLQRCVSECLK